MLLLEYFNMKKYLAKLLIICFFQIILSSFRMVDCGARFSNGYHTAENQLSIDIAGCSYNLFTHSRCLNEAKLYFDRSVENLGAAYEKCIGQY